MSFPVVDTAVDVQVYNECGPGRDLAQAHFCVHGLDDVLWTNDPQAAADYIKNSLDVAAKAWVGEKSERP